MYARVPTVYAILLSKILLAGLSQVSLCTSGLERYASASRNLLPRSCARKRQTPVTCEKSSQGPIDPRRPESYHVR
jgi:hypothetical protein